MKQITKFVKRKFQGRSENFHEVPGWSFEVSIQSFILNFKVYYQSYKVRVRLNLFDCIGAKSLIYGGLTYRTLMNYSGTISTLYTDGYTLVVWKPWL